MIENRQLTDEQTEVRGFFRDWLESDAYEDKYGRRIDTMLSEGKSRLILDMNDLLDYTPPGQPVSLGQGLIKRPTNYLPLCELAVHDQVIRRQPDYLKVDFRQKHIHVGLEGPVGKVHGPRHLYARHLNTLVALEGIVTKQSPLRPRVLETVHYCPATNKYSRKEYRDALTPLLDGQHLPTVNVMPKTDMQGNPLRTELGLSSFVDSQCAIMQEAPESAPTGQIPRYIELRFDDDLVDSVKPGDRVQVVGVFAPYTMNENKGSFQTIVLVNNVVRCAALARVPKLLDSHRAEIQRFVAGCRGKSPTYLLDILSNSIAPAIFGLYAEKKAILMALLGGVERKVSDTHIRGDINILLVGEPSTAKSQLLRYVLGLAPLVLNTTGKGSSGVGLTAAVTHDQYTNEKSLSAGAMVLADRGILCIDEFDKMNANDRVTMHEAMEQQTVTIAKAGITASLNARCSVLAAANPVYGFYSVRHKLAYNVGLPESLLSRFDLTFIILDQHSSEYNRRIGSHVLKNHRTATPVGLDLEVSKTVVEREAAETAAAGGNAPDLAAGSGHTVLRNNSGEPIVPVTFLRRYIEFAKSFTPTLTPASRVLIVQHYEQLRDEQTAEGNQTKDGFFVTPRTLEALVRLSTAHAKLQLRNTVDEEDVLIAISLLRASVHAAAAAVEQRQKDNEAVAHGEAPAAERVPVPPGGEAGNAQRKTGATREEDAEVERARKVQRLETSFTTPAPTHMTADSVNRIIVDTLSLFRRESRDQVHLHELRDRLTQNTLGRGMSLDLPSLQSVVSQLDADAEQFSFVSTPTEDVIYFH